MLKIFFSTLFIYNGIQIFEYVRDKYSFQYEDWLINYSNGFVRRGFIGELLIKLAQIINVNLQLIVFLFLIFLLLIFYYKSFELFSKIKLNLVVLFLIFSPFYFSFYLVNHNAGVRKEFFLFIFFCYLILKVNIKNVDKNLWKFSFFFPVLILIHEGLFFYLSFYVLFVLFFLTNKKNINSIFFQLLITISISILIFYLSFIFKGSTEHVITICNSLNGYVKETCIQSGAINQLRDKFIPAVILVFSEHNGISVFKWILITIYSYVPIFYLLKNVIPKENLFVGKFLNIKTINLIIIFLILNFISMLPLFFVAFDWGRWLAIYYHLIALVLVYLINNQILLIKKKSININKKVIFVLILYSTFITPNVFDKISSNTDNVYKLNYIRLLKKIN